jgi:peptidylprolyl isomerase
MSKTPMRHRIFAGMGAGLFLLTASALTIAVIYDMVTNKSNTTAKTDTAATCSIDGSVATTEILPAPDVYKHNGTVSALETTDLIQGSGAAAKTGDCMQMKYYGMLASTGAMFDENYTLATLLQFKLGAGQVIPGWDQGLVGMKAGGTRRVVIPAVLAYGSQAQGRVPANSDLVFMVKLVKIKS